MNRYKHAYALVLLAVLCGLAQAVPGLWSEALPPAGFEAQRARASVGCDHLDCFVRSGGLIRWRSSHGDLGDLTQFVPTAEEVTARELESREAAIKPRRILRALLVILKRLEASNPGLLDGTEIDAIIAEVQGS
jgi:hypothetical protein